MACCDKKPRNFKATAWNQATRLAHAAREGTVLPAPLAMRFLPLASYLLGRFHPCAVRHRRIVAGKARRYPF
jgi:hypothetical protein